jgi:arylsulfatase A-like enzyme
MSTARSLLILLAAVAGAVFPAPGPAKGAETTTPARPNFLLLFLDNVGYVDLGCYGNAAVRTPNIDPLAAEGVRCTDFYTAAPSCTPSRGAILTGRHPVRNGLNHQLTAPENAHGIGLRQAERLIPQYLKPLGYTSGVFGKWNIGFAPGSRPAINHVLRSGPRLATDLAVELVRESRDEGSPSRRCDRNSHRLTLPGRQP